MTSDTAVEKLNMQKSFSERTITLVLIIFCAVCWGILWNEVQHLIWKIVNISPESLIIHPFGLVSLPSEKKKIIAEVLKKGLIHDFYWTHFFFIIVSFLLVPLSIGFYLGRHSERNKFLHCFFIIVIVTLFRPILDLFSDRNINAFLLIIILKGFLISPFLFILTSLGAFIGGFFKARHGEGIYLTIYRNILEKRRKGIIFMMVTILMTALSFKGLEKVFFDDLLSPYYKYAYARVDFNKYSKEYHPRPPLTLKEYPLLRAVKPTSEDPDSWPKLISLSNGDEFAFIFFIINSNYIYSAVNTKLSLLRNDAHHFTATLRADNAEPVRQSIEIAHNCSNPVFSHISNNWYFMYDESKQSLPMPSGQTGLEVLKPTGINLGNLPSMYAGMSNFIIKFKYSCSDRKN
jgi:hypothetical protein